MKGWALGERSVEREVEMMTALHLAWGNNTPIWWNSKHIARGFLEGLGKFSKSFPSFIILSKQKYINLKHSPPPLL